MKTLLVPAALLTLLVSCSPDNNRRGGDTGMAEGAPGGLSTRDTMPTSPGDSAPAGGDVAVSPEAVLSQMNVANTAEIQLSSLAAKKAMSAQVKQIAKKLAADHTKNREQVRALAQRVNVTLTPSQGGSVSAGDGVALPPDLQDKAGADFDKAFVQHEIDDHQANIERIQGQMLPGVQDQQIRSYLQKTVADMQTHLSSLEQVQKQLGS
jgi:putative membrane protein